MKGKMKKKLIAFLLCMVLVVCNSVSILADTPAETTTVEQQAKETRAVKEETGSEEDKDKGDGQDISVQSEESEEEEAPEVKTTEKKENTAEASTEKEESTTEASTEKNDSTTAVKDNITKTDKTTGTTEEETTEATETSDKDQTTGAEDDSDKKDKTSETSEEETTETTEKTTETTEEESTEKAEKTTQSPAYDGKYEDSTVTISVTAEAGIVPEGAELSVTPIEKTEITDSMSEEDKAEAEKINAQYDLTEKKLTEDSEANEETMEGFLAYDISFIIDGKEVEPSGDVKVVMDFKEAAVPEGVSEDATVEVKHLKEVESAADGVVVEDMAGKATVESTDKAEVQKVEMTSDSFSTFTITWTTSGNTITVHYVNEEYQEITSNNVQSKNVSIEDDVRIVLKDEYARDINGYTYSYASIGKEDTSPRVYSVRVNSKNGDLQYRVKQNDQSWQTWNSTLGYHVYLVYNTNLNSTSAVIETVDNDAENITMHLFDYSTGDNESSKYKEGGYDKGINSGKTLKFLSDASGTKFPLLDSINQWTGNSGVRQGIVKDRLQGGYPVLEGHNNQSLSYLFATTPAAGKMVYDGANYLFTKDEDGYFRFDSDTNYAEFNTSTENFTVYSNPYRAGLKAFYPFDSFSSIVNKYRKGEGLLYGENGNGGWGLGAGNANHYFGLTMSATFYQPEDGKINNNDMVFDFSGDDDVWVFIDNQLVLDLGGIHDRASGSINFQTGDILINGQFDYNMYSGAEKVFDGKFEDYSIHTISFFYLERGNNASNCKLTFNLPTIPQGSVMVTKQVTGNDNIAVDYAQDIDFQFNIKKNGAVLANTGYEIRNESNQIVGTGETDDNGNFTLKHGQRAIFEGFLAIDKYEVKEIGASLNVGYEVTIDSVDVVLNNQEGTAEQTLQSASTGEQQVSDLSSAVFRNKIRNTATLSIQKLIDSDDQETLADKTFNIRVWINGELYSSSYSVGTDERTATNGIISLTGGQTATITGLPYGVAIEVEEVLDGSCRPTYAISENTYNVVLPSLDEDGNQLLDEDGNPVSDVTSASANISGNATVTVTNHKVNVDSGTTKLTVQKTWEEGTDNIRPEAINVTLYQDNNNNGIKDEGDTVATGITATVLLNETNEWTHTWENLPADTNFVVEESEVNVGDLSDFKSETTLTSSFVFKYLDRVTTCRNLTYLLGKNNMLLVKLTSNSGYILWTPVNLGLSEAEVQKISNSIKKMSLPGSGNLSDVNLRYVWGTTDSKYTNGITLSRTDTGWELDFGATSNWAQFWNLHYDRTINAEINNTLDNTIDIPVEKQWSGDMQMWENVKYIKVQLYQNNTVFGNEVAISENQDGEWTYTFEDLAKYYKDENGKYIPYEYSVEETLIYYSEKLQRDPKKPDGFTVEYSGNAEDRFLIENIWIHDWQIFKVSSTDGDFPLVLGGAEFSLTKVGDSIPSYYGATYDHDECFPEDFDQTGYVEGKVYWWKEEANKGTIAQAEKYIEDGTYILKETKAPDGYLVNSVTWTIEIEDLAVVSITDSNGQTITKYTPGASTRAAIQVDSYLFEDTPIYELPSAGGPGIYWYTLSGALLMMGAALIVYKQQRKREVLLKK